MKDYKLNGSVYEITLENEKVVKVASKWVETAIQKLDTDLEDVLLMWLEDNDYLVNEELEELDSKAKINKIKLVATSEKPKKTPKERVQKENPTKELIISKISEILSQIDGISNLNVENKTKLITFSLNNEDFKVDLVQKRKPKQEK